MFMRDLCSFESGAALSSVPLLSIPTWQCLEPAADRIQLGQAVRRQSNTLTRAMRLSPLIPAFVVQALGLALAYFLLGATTKRCIWADRALRETGPNCSSRHFESADRQCGLAVGRMEPRDAAETLLQIDPAFRISRLDRPWPRFVDLNSLKGSKKGLRTCGPTRMTEQRRLAAILVADVVGYSKLIGSDEAGTLAQLEALRTEIIEPHIAKHAGRLFKSVGDGFLIEFASAVQAVSCAKAIQEANGLGRLPLRIGIHVGDVVVQGDDLMGDGVNVAARVEGIADPGGIAITRAVHEQVRDKLDLGFMDKGEIELKNIQRPVQVFVIGGAKVDSQATALPLPDKPSIAVLPFQNMSGDPEQEYFADGMVEDIIAALSRVQFALCHRAQLDLHLQGPRRGHQAGRPRPGRPLRAGRQRAKGRRAHSHQRPTDRRCKRYAPLGRPVRRRA